MPLGLTYFKRYRMEYDLARPPLVPELPPGFRFLAWDSRLLAAHAETKYRSFRQEIDANVFPCFNDYDGCLRLMNEISRKDGFLPETTWLVAHEERTEGERTSFVYCGTVQGIRDRTGYGAIQNLGVTPEFRGYGLGGSLLLKALEGFHRAGLRRVYLEVTAQNEGAVRLYRRLGFHRTRTVYKAVDQAMLSLR